MFKDNDCQVTNMWNVFKETITKSAVKHIPQKRTRVKDSRPWINTEIRNKSEKATKTTSRKRRPVTKIRKKSTNNLNILLKRSHDNRGRTTLGNEKILDIHKTQT